MPLSITILIARIVLVISRRLWRGGGALPGLIALKMRPDIISRLSATLVDGVVLITGTNGKTTTARMASAILSTTNKRLVQNKTGSNLARGIASALIEKSNLLGKVQADLGVFEVDEAALPQVVTQSNPRAVMVLNLFRDQLDRYGELDLIANKIGQSLSREETTVILCADDPLVASIAKNAKGKVIYFGVNEAGQEKMVTDMAADSHYCPMCGQGLDYERIYYGHMGIWSCPAGDFKRPDPDYRLSSHKTLEMSGNGQKAQLSLRLHGLYNAYNALAASALASFLGVPLEKSVEVLAGLTAAFGRAEVINLSGVECTMLLIKNPTGFNQVIQTYLLNKPLPLLIIINDDFADGRDVSWLWDAALEELAEVGHSIIVSGTRAYDMALRLKYANISAQVEPDIARAVDMLKTMAVGGEAAILPTYTAMRSVRHLIGKQAKLADMWGAK